MADSIEVYTAVPLLAEEEEEICNDEVETAEDIVLECKKYRVALFLLGFFCGCVAAIAGRSFLPNNTGESRTRDVGFDLVWSILTGLVSFIVFETVYSIVENAYNAHRSIGKVLMTDSFRTTMEYFFAMGFFFGLITACTITDFIFGIPVISILVTIFVTAIWTLTFTKMVPWLLVHPVDEVEKIVLSV